MKCGDFELALNDRIDARGALTPALTEAIEGHAAVCPSCRTLAARYEALGRALLLALPTPAPSPGFADRVLAAAASGQERPIAGRIGPRIALLSLAAAVVVAVAPGLISRRAGPGRVVTTPAAARVRAIDPNDLADALDDARSATWDLAREASAPAARVGREMLGASERPQLSSTLALPAAVGPAAEVWRGVEERVNAGVRPLEGSARHAFGFLLGDSPDDDRPPARPAEGA